MKPYPGYGVIGVQLNTDTFSQSLQKLKNNKLKQTNMLEYYKAILDRVSFDPVLFRKELRKAFKSLPAEAQTALRDWLKGSPHLSH